MSDEFEDDWYKRVVGGELGKGYFSLVVHLVELRLLVGWLVTQSCFFVVLPLPDNEFELIVKSEMQYLMLSEHQVELGLIKEAVENGD